MARGRFKPDRKKIGLAYLLELAGNPVPLPQVVHYAGGSQRKEVHTELGTEITVPARESPQDVRSNLSYALRKEAIDVRAWIAVASHLGPLPFTEWVRSQPTGRHARRAWYLYEQFVGEKLPVPDTPSTNYASLADPRLQVVTSRPATSARHKVFDNLLGGPGFCPLIRNTPGLQNAASLGLEDLARQIVLGIDERDLQRATDYLYHKETKASFQIEREDVSHSRMERFVAALRGANDTRWYDEPELVLLQNDIVEPRYRESEFREIQNYVGETRPWGTEIVHYACPQPEDVRHLMEAWRVCLSRTMGIDPVCQAAVLGYGFVFIHPFEDGNGRIHRFILHATLARRKFTPAEIVIPVSATMLRRRDKYDASLEAHSKSIMPFVDYSLDESGSMTVHNDTSWLYQYWDATEQCEYLFETLEESLKVDLPDELRALRAYDAGLRALLEVVDMPDKRAALMMRLLIQHSYQLSKRKRELFPEITDDELHMIEQVVREAAESSPGGDGQQGELGL